MKIRVITYIAAVLALVGCRKDAPLPPSDVNPDFHATALVNGNEVSMTAGDEGYYMHTDYTMENGLVYMVGDLNANEVGKPSWKFGFANSEEGENVDVYEVLSLGEKNLQAVTTYVPVDGFIGIKPGIVLGADDATHPQYYWRFQFGGRVMEPSPTFPFDSTNYSGVQPVVTIGIRPNNVDFIETSRCVDIRHPEAIASYHVEVLSNGTFLCYLDPMYQSDVTQVLWHVNNQYNSTGDTLLYKASPEDGAEVDIQAAFRHNGGGRTCQTREIPVRDYFGNGSPALPLVDFGYEVNTLSRVDSMQLNTVRVEYTDKFGEVFRTDLHHDPGTITIEEVTEYQNDLNGRPTVKLHIKGSFLLRSANGEALLVEDADFLIAVATQDP